MMYAHCDRLLVCVE
jgi:hypothetical protein